MAKQSKRILKVVIKRMVDESPDTSYLGEYGATAKSDYAIDRQHATDCNAVTHSHEGKAQLGRIWQHLNDTEDTDQDAYLLVDELLTGFEDCDCSGGDMGRNEYRFFNPNHENYAGCTEEEIRKYCAKDYERMESLNAGNWCYIGIRAEAQVQLSGDVVQDITSGGLWGIESDSGRDYFAEIEQDELNRLREQLQFAGFGTRAISNAFKNVNKEDC